MDWLGKSWEGPVTDVLVGLRIEDARQAADGIAGIEMIREMDPEGAYTFDHRANRLSLLVVDGVVVAAAMV